MSRQCRITYADLGNPCKSGLQRRQQLSAHLTDQLFYGIISGYISAHIGIEEQRICKPEAVLSETADRNVQIQADILVDYTKRYRRRCSVLVAGDFLGVEIIDSLILGGFSSEGKTLSDHLEDFGNTFPEIAGKHGRLRRGIVLVFTRFCTDIYDFTLLDYQHALTVGDRNDRSAGDDIVKTMVSTAECGTFPSFRRQNGVRQRFAVKILLPLIRKNAGSGSERCMNKSHLSISFRCLKPSDHAKRLITVT